MARIRDQANAWKVRAVTFDPRYLDVPAKMLADEGHPLAMVMALWELHQGPEPSPKPWFALG